MVRTPRSASAGVGTSPPPRPTRSIVVSQTARTLRRQLGPTAWTVLEELLLEVVGDNAMVVETHVRRIADSAGISKDSAARAVRRLMAHGVVTRHDGRDTASGRFGRAVYELHPDAIAEAIVPAGPGNSAVGQRVSAARRTAASRAPERNERQASLFDGPNESLL